MPVTSLFRTGFARRLAFSAVLAAVVACGEGCVMDGSASTDESTNPAATRETGSKALRDAPADGIPQGCSLQWSSTAHDSLLYCPDIRPPKPI